MQVPTTRFGTIEVDESKVITFEEGLPGLGRASKFIVLPHKPAHGLQSPFPWLADPHYSPTIPGLALAKLAITNVSEQGRIYAVVTVPRSNPEGATINLVAPLLVNKLTRRALQVVLQQERFSLRMPLKEAASGAGLCEPIFAIA